MKPTKDTYDRLDKAYHYFNQKLFGKRLPPCVMTLHRRKNTYGYFWGNMWSERDGETLTDEIALNPELFFVQTTQNILSTLVHEMCHLEQHHFGKPSRNGYHNKEWAGMMDAVGLIPTDTGNVGGKRTGQRMSHTISEGSSFDLACTTLIGKGFAIPWQALSRDENLAKKKAASKTKYMCPDCGLNAWAKPKTRIGCLECDMELEEAA